MLVILLPSLKLNLYMIRECSIEMVVGIGNEKKKIVIDANK